MDSALKRAASPPYLWVKGKASLQLLPLAAMLLMLTLGKHRKVLLLGVVAALLELLLALDLYRSFEPGKGRCSSPSERLGLIKAFSYHAAADGMTVLLNALLTLMVVIYGPMRQLKSQPTLFAVIFAVVALRPGELFLVCVLGLMILIGGIYPDGVLDLTRAAG